MWSGCWLHYSLQPCYSVPHNWLCAVVCIHPDPGHGQAEGLNTASRLQHHACFLQLPTKVFELDYLKLEIQVREKHSFGIIGLSEIRNTCNKRQTVWNYSLVYEYEQWNFQILRLFFEFCPKRDQCWEYQVQIKHKYQDLKCLNLNRLFVVIYTCTKP